MTAWIPLLSTLIAALVALLGYLVNQVASRRERKAEFYAQALLVVKEFEEIPYRIAKRKDSDPETRERLGNSVNDAFVKMSFYRAWLRIDSPRVAMAYDSLARRASRLGEDQQRHAWSREVISADEDMDLGSQYYYGTKPELELCVLAMRRELSLWSVVSGPLTKRAVRAQQQRRLEQGEPVGELDLGNGQ